MADEYQELSSDAIVLFGSRRYREAAEKFEQALAIPSDAADRVPIEWAAGVTYTHFIQPGVPLSQLVREPYFLRAIELMESAIRHDLEQGGAYFREPTNWSRTCQLDGLYASVADVLEENQSDAAALAYLLDHATIIQAGAMLESSARIGQYSTRTGNDAKAIEWYQRAAAMPRITGDANESQTRGFVTRELNRLTKKGGCFIATAAYGGPDASAVKILQTFRDDHLQRSRVGRCAIRVYYILSPPFAHLISRSHVRRRIARTFLWPVVRIAHALRRNRRLTSRYL